MIETKLVTKTASIVSGVESIGGGLYPAELAERERRVRQAKSKPRYCENPECWAIEHDRKDGEPGKPQRLTAYNIVIMDDGAYRHTQPSRLCSRCIQAGVELPKKKRKSPQVKWKRSDLRKEQCVNGHNIAEVGRYKSGECCQCHREANLRRYHRRKAKRDAEREAIG